MMHTKFFLIEPRGQAPADLAQLLTDDELLLCCAPQLMSHEIADKSGWTTADMCFVVKLAYLAQTLDIFRDEQKRAQIFGSADISEAVFDRWWSIKQIEYLGQTIEFSRELKSFSTKLRSSDSPVVKEWLQRMITK